MTDLTSRFSDALKTHNAPPITTGSCFPKVDEYLKEAYRIHSHIASLHAYLRSIRRAYLSTSQPQRKNQLEHKGNLNPILSSDKERRYLSGAQRDQVDAESKQLLRELNAAIRNLSDAEKLRQNTASTLLQRQRARNGLGVLGKWAAGVSETLQSPEGELAEAKASGINKHRESVLWYLRHQLEECGEFQRSMTEIRLTREVEKSKSVLYKTRGSKDTSRAMGLAEQVALGVDSVYTNTSNPRQYTGSTGAQLDETERRQIEQQLSPEQLQLFAQENQDLLKHFEDTLDQVRTAERSMAEISELQTTLATNLATQSAHVDQLVADSVNTADNVTGGNKQLKRASERKSTAKYVFYVSCGLSLFLVGWDLLV
ncbi:MAG: hypothetical protein M1812_008044 [Candelaria pacifica]|nr:MAG: hypothetical protein M1812_008044 [Candelaria pacifica]